jgi:hypothetical protein
MGYSSSHKGVACTFYTVQYNLRGHIKEQGKITLDLLHSTLMKELATPQNK